MQCHLVESTPLSLELKAVENEKRATTRFGLARVFVVPKREAFLNVAAFHLHSLGGLFLFRKRGEQNPLVPMLNCGFTRVHVLQYVDAFGGRQIALGRPNDQKIPPCAACVAPFL